MRRTILTNVTSGAPPSSQKPSCVHVVVVVVLTLTRIIKSVVTGQAPVTLELRNTLGEKTCILLANSYWKTLHGSHHTVEKILPGSVLASSSV